MPMVSIDLGFACSCFHRCSNKEIVMANVKRRFAGVGDPEPAGTAHCLRSRKQISRTL